MTSDDDDNNDADGEDHDDDSNYDDDKPPNFMDTSQQHRPLQSYIESKLLVEDQLTVVKDGKRIFAGFNAFYGLFD
jgi:hypothetical protein